MRKPSRPSRHREAVRGSGREDVYEFDIFLSYRRRGPALDWVNNHFFPKLRGWLEQYWPEDLGRESGRPRLAKDDEMEAGSRWPASLRKMHAGSKVMLAVLSQEYFRSSWCLAEWEAMRLRERKLGMRTKGLIYPVLFCGDPSDLPRDASTRQCVDFSAMNTPDEIFRKHASYVEFDRAMQTVARDVVAMVRRAPPRGRWPVLTTPPSPSRVRALLPRLAPVANAKHKRKA
jgi:hypothetical protein